MTLCGLLASVAMPTEDPVRKWILRPVFVAFVMVLHFLFMKNIAKTLRGYSVLMMRRTNEDGTLPEARMVDAVKGKLTEVVCEAAPQSVHQVLSCPLIYRLISLPTNIHCKFLCSITSNDTFTRGSLGGH